MPLDPISNIYAYLEWIFCLSDLADFLRGHSKNHLIKKLNSLDHPCETRSGPCMTVSKPSVHHWSVPIAFSGGAGRWQARSPEPQTQFSVGLLKILLALFHLENKFYLDEPDKMGFPPAPLVGPLCVFFG